MTKWQLVASWVVVAVGLYQSGPVVAQVNVQALQQQYEREGPAAAELLAVQADPGSFIVQLGAKWAATAEQRGYGEGWAEELESVARLAPAERLLAASKATTYEGVVAALFAQGRGGASPQVLGDDNSDLVFFPLTPCRLFDTRSSAAGLLAANTSRTFAVNGTLTGQGGNPAGCGVPTDPAAIVATLTITQPQGTGNLRAFAFSTPPPLASVLNYQGDQLSLANTTVIPVCQVCGMGLDIVVQADVAGTHVLADVVGYFWSPFATPLDVLLLQTTATILNATDFSLESPACPAGRSVVGGGIVYSAVPTGVILFETGPRIDQTTFFCTGRNNSGISRDVNCRVLCGRTPGR